GRAGGIGVRAQAAGSAGADPIAVARGGEEPGVAIRGTGRGPDLGEIAGGPLAALDEVARHGAGGGGPSEIDLAAASGRRGQVGGGGRGRRRLGGGAGGIGVRAQAAGSAGLDPIGVALGSEEPGVAIRGAGRGPDLGEVATAGLLAALDQVAGHGAGGGGPSEIDLAAASGRCGQARWGRWWRSEERRAGGVGVWAGADRSAR